LARYGDYAPYVTVAERREEAQKIVKKLRKQGKVVNPVEIDGRLIASTFWGKSWNKNLEVPCTLWTGQNLGLFK